MEQSLCWFFDAVAVGIILIFVYVGAKKGFVRNIAYTVLIIASFLASWFAAEALAPFVYDAFVKEEITQLLYERADSIRPAEIISQTVSDGDYGVEMSESEISQIMSGSSDFFAGLATEMRKNGSPESEVDIASGVRDAATPRLLDSLFSGASDSGEASFREGSAAADGDREAESFPSVSPAESDLLPASPFFA